MLKLNGGSFFGNGLQVAQGQKLTFDGATGSKYFSSDGTNLSLVGLDLYLPAGTVQALFRGIGAGVFTADNFTADGAAAVGFKFRIQGGPFANAGSRIARFENPGNTVKMSIGKNGQLFYPTGNADSVAGTATLVGGTVTVNTTAVSAASIILLTRNTSGGTIGDLKAPTGSIVAATSFAITSASGTDTSTVNWLIIN